MLEAVRVHIEGTLTVNISLCVSGRAKLRFQSRHSFLNYFLWLIWRTDVFWKVLHFHRFFFLSSSFKKKWDFSVSWISWKNSAWNIFYFNAIELDLIYLIEYNVCIVALQIHSEN